MTPAQRLESETPELESVVERLDARMGQMTLEEGITRAEARAAEAEERAAAAEERAAAAEARTAEAVRRARIELVAAVAAARAIASAVAVASAVAGAARVPAAEATQQQQIPNTIKKSLKLPGIYVYHVGCLTVKYVDRPEEVWCVVKVGKAAEGESSKCINDRLGPECEDIKQWRGSPKAPRITAKSLRGNNDVGDLIMCLPGSTMVGVEKKVRQILGLPLGVGRIVAHQKKVLNQMQARGPGGALQDCGRYQNAGDNKIRALGWKMYLYKSDRDLDDGWNIGPSELIMMPKRAMQKLRRKFRENCSKFASQNNTYDDVDGGRGPAWDYIRDASKALPHDWHEKEVTVQFKKTGRIGPLRLQLWDRDLAEAKKKQRGPGRPRKK